MTMWQTWGSPSRLKWNRTIDPCDGTWTGVKCDTQNVVAVGVNGMGLVHQLDPAVGQLTTLSLLDVGNNQLTGSIPQSLSALLGLLELNLGTNRLSGTIPDQLSALVKLKGLFLDRSNLAGNIPPQLSALTSLTSLYLNGNLLTGCIPTGLSKMYAVLGHTQFRVFNNPFVCDFPDSDQVGHSPPPPPPYPTFGSVHMWICIVAFVVGVFFGCLMSTVVYVILTACSARASRTALAARPPVVCIRRSGPTSHRLTDSPTESV